MTDFVANRQAKVSAFLGGVPLPDSIIQTVQAQLGVTSIYRKIGYCECCDVLCSSLSWPPILLNLITQ
ncbi:hypothetical protein BD414DRAFT_487291 [Trametes punicea]|nr:hypothetical protein BD414DRAFT_487291 [Trametes punicea]